MSLGDDKEQYRRTLGFSLWTVKYMSGIKRKIIFHFVWYTFWDLFCNSLSLYLSKTDFLTDQLPPTSHYKKQGCIFFSVFRSKSIMFERYIRCSIRYWKSIFKVGMLWIWLSAGLLLWPMCMCSFLRSARNVWPCEQPQPGTSLLHIWLKLDVLNWAADWWWQQWWLEPAVGSSRRTRKRLAETE